MPQFIWALSEKTLKVEKVSKILGQWGFPQNVSRWGEAQLDKKN